jgi:MFS family permease
LTAAAIVPWAGRVLDRYGGRIVLTAVAALFGLAALLMSRVASPVHLFCGIVALRALGQGSLSLVSTTLVAMWFVRRRGRAMALTTLVSPVSKAVFPLLVHQLISPPGFSQRTVPRPWHEATPAALP